MNTSVNAIKGIANLAAISGSTSQQASTAMYQLSQALASGTVKLMDWNSVVNAGMGGQVFQDALKMTARIHGIAIDEMIADEGSFRETLSKGWLTSDILTETLQHFTEFTDTYNEESLKRQGYNEKEIAEIKQMGITATDAATKVKTLSQLYDVMKETAQSGWAATWKILLGDFEEAKESLTKFSNMLNEPLAAAADARNKILSEGFSSGWKQFLNEGIEDIILSGDECYIPHEVLVLPRVVVRVGVYGTDGENVILPTIWATLGMVHDAPDPSGDPSTDPSLPIWSTLRNDIGSLEDLLTKDKESLVAAINEVVQNGGGGAGGGTGTDYDADRAILNDFTLIYNFTTGTGTLTAQCLGAAPTVNIPVKVVTFT